MSKQTGKKDQLNKRPRSRDARVGLTENKINKKIKVTKEITIHSHERKRSPATAFESNVSTKSTSSGSAGSVLSLDLADSDPIAVDFDCRTIENNQFCMRKSKAITYQNVFKKSTKTKIEFDLRKDDLIARQYRVIKMMGKGTFSHVYLCRDISSNRDIALKIFTQRNQASLVKIEQAIAQHLKRLDPKDVYNFVKMLDTFRCRNQFFIVYESLGYSLYDYMAKVRKKNYTIKEIREVSRQLCITLDFLHGQKIIHTDIKPGKLRDL